MSHFMGMDGFVWFFGKVVDRNDPNRIGRVRVRVFGLHPEDQELVPNDHLPWAAPIMPITSAAHAGIGNMPVGMVEGTIVFGFFADGNDAQLPFILGTVPGGLGHFELTVQKTAKDLVADASNLVNNIASSFSNKLPATFISKANSVGRFLMKDLGITDIQAAAILGNFSVESGLVPNIRYGGSKGPAIEGKNQPYGWAQWLGPRKTAFHSFVLANFGSNQALGGTGYDIYQHEATDEMNYRYLLQELNSSHKYAVNALKKTNDIQNATTVWLQKFEGVTEKNVKEWNSLQQRIAAATQVLNALKGANVNPRGTGGG